MTWENLNRKIWRMWKDKYTLSRMAREVSRVTSWSEYLSLCYVLDFLHNKKGVGFSRKQIRYAFRKLPPEDVEGEERGAWAWLLKIGGYNLKVKRDVKTSLYLAREGGIYAPGEEVKEGVI